MASFLTNTLNSLLRSLEKFDDLYHHGPISLTPEILATPSVPGLLSSGTCICSDFEPFQRIEDSEGWYIVLARLLEALNAIHGKYRYRLEVHYLRRFQSHFKYYNAVRRDIRIYYIWLPPGARKVRLSEVC